jgi:hypothetical protein
MCKKGRVNIHPAQPVINQIASFLKGQTLLTDFPIQFPVNPRINCLGAGESKAQGYIKKQKSKYNHDKITMEQYLLKLEYV